MIAGPRTADRNWLRGLLARASAHRLVAFVVPGPEIPRAAGLDLAGAGIQTATTPRHANVLLLAGPIPPGLGASVAVVYAQMPRPRGILAIGSSAVPSVPQPDVSVAPHQAALVDGVKRLRQLFGAGAWAAEAPDVEPESHDTTGAEISRGEGHRDLGRMEARDPEGMRTTRREFMPMAMMTMDLPRAADGLPMERFALAVGPLSPGLPGGLSLTFGMDGDTVAEVTHIPGVVSRALAASWPGVVGSFPDRLERVDPLAPLAYRVLAWRALEQAAGVVADEAIQRQRVGALERERAASHLNWLANFGFLLGYPWLHRDAAAMHREALALNGRGSIERLLVGVERLRKRVVPVVRARLRGLGRVDQALASQLRGPLARAAGIETDARVEDAAYQRLGFRPVVGSGDDVLARLEVRLAEVRQSLELAQAAGSAQLPDLPRPDAAGTATATVETPRGAARLTVTLAGGTVGAATLQTPSAAHARQIRPVAEDRELSDALLSIASLDLSPWEIDQ